MDYEKLWQDLIRAYARSHARGDDVSPEQADEFVRTRSKGAVPDVAELRRKLHQRDIQPGVGEGIARSTSKGLSFGFNDELSGLVDAAVGGGNPGAGRSGRLRPASGDGSTPGERYRTTRDAERGADNAFRSAHGGLAALSEIIGGLPLALGTLGAGGPATIGSLAKTGALYGAGAGAVSGAGNAGELSDVPREIALGGVVGGAAGGVLGALSKPAGDVLGGLGRGARRILAPEADALASAQGAMSRVIPADAGARMTAANAVRPGQAILGDLNPAALDVAGNFNPAVRQRTSDLLMNRNAGADTRLASDLTDAAVGAPRNAPDASRFVDVKEAQAFLKTETRPIAERLYRPLEKSYDVLTMNDQTAPMFEALTDPITSGVYQSMAYHEGQSTSFRTMQAVLQKLKSKASANFATAGGQDLAVKQVTAARALENGMEQAMPGFKAVNRGYARTMEMVKAFEQGATAMRQDPRDITSALAKLSPNSRSAYRMAALDDYVAKLQALSPEANAFRQSLRRGKDTIEPHLRALFGSTAEMDKFLAGADVEQMFRRSFESLAGSKTANRSAVAKEMFGHGDDMPTSLAAFFKNLATAGRDERIATEMGPRLLARSGSPEMRAVLAEIEATRRSLLQRDVTRTTGVRLLGTGAGEQVHRLQRAPR